MSTQSLRRETTNKNATNKHVCANMWPSWIGDGSRVLDCPRSGHGLTRIKLRADLNSRIKYQPTSRKLEREELT
eukprot:2197940-Amphidinium_carterae.1